MTALACMNLWVLVCRFDSALIARPERYRAPSTIPTTASFSLGLRARRFSRRWLHILRTESFLSCRLKSCLVPSCHYLPCRRQESSLVYLYGFFLTSPRYVSLLRESD